MFVKQGICIAVYSHHKGDKIALMMSTGVIEQ